MHLGGNKRVEESELQAARDQAHVPVDERFLERVETSARREVVEVIYGSDGDEIRPLGRRREVRGELRQGRPEGIRVEVGDPGDVHKGTEFVQAVGDCLVEEPLLGAEEVVEGAARECRLLKERGQAGRAEAIGGECETRLTEKARSSFRIERLCGPGHGHRPLFCSECSRVNVIRL